MKGMVTVTRESIPPIDLIVRSYIHNPKVPIVQRLVTETLDDTIEADRMLRKEEINYVFIRSNGRCKRNELNE